MDGEGSNQCIEKMCCTLNYLLFFLLYSKFCSKAHCWYNFHDVNTPTVACWAGVPAGDAYHGEK